MVRTFCFNLLTFLLSSLHPQFLFFCTDKTIKLWKIGERDKRAEGYNLKDEDGRLRDPFRITSLRVGLKLLYLLRFQPTLYKKKHKVYACL